MLYIYCVGAAIQTMECLKLFEHMASTMAECMAVVAREFGVPKTTQDVLRYSYNIVLVVC